MTIVWEFLCPASSLFPLSCLLRLFLGTDLCLSYQRFFRHLILGCLLTFTGRALKYPWEVLCMHTCMCGDVGATAHWLQASSRMVSRRVSSGSLQVCLPALVRFPWASARREKPGTGVRGVGWGRRLEVLMSIIKFMYFF